MDLVLKITFVSAIVAFTVIAAVWDVRWRRLPNWLTVPAFFAGVGYWTVVGLVSDGGVWPALGNSLLGALVGFGPLFLLFLIGGGGAGDVKLITAIGAWFGPMPTFIAYVLGTVIGILGSGVLLMFKAGTQGFGRAKHDFLERREQNPKKKKKRSLGGPQRTRARKQLVPLGLAFAISAWVILAYQTFTNKLPATTASAVNSTQTIAE